MNEAFTSFLTLPERDRRDVFAAAAVRLDTLPSYVEKDSATPSVCPVTGTGSRGTTTMPR